MLKDIPKIDLMSNPSFKEFIEAFNRIAKETENLSLEETRRRSTAFFLPSDTTFMPMHRIENIAITGSDQNNIPLRIYIPNDSLNLPVMLYFHRGGWVFGNINEAEPVCRKLAHFCNCIVVAVEYRLAPESAFPKPLNDCLSATGWASSHIRSYGGDPEQLMVCGESAGGNMAAAVSLMVRDNGGPQIKAQILLCPVISSATTDEAYERCPDRYFITKDAMRFFWSMYLQESGQGQNPYASPDFAHDFRKLPRALIVTAEFDPLEPEAEEYAQKLQQAGNKVATIRVPGVIHGFIDLPIYDEKQKCSWIEEIAEALHQLLK